MRKLELQCFFWIIGKVGVVLGSACVARSNKVSCRYKPGFASAGLALMLMGSLPAQSGDGSGDNSSSVASSTEGESLKDNDPVAIVENVEPPSGAAVALMDYLYAGGTVELAEDSRLEIVYFESCRAETILGGRVEVGTERSDVAGGDVEAEQIECSQPQRVVSADRGRAGATVEREGGAQGADQKNSGQAADQNEGKEYGHQLGALDPDSNSIWEVPSNRPWFKWPDNISATGTVRLTVVTADQTPPRMMWSTRTEKDSIRYAGNAPALTVGEHYRVRLTNSGDTLAKALFTPTRPMDKNDTNVATQLVPLAE